MTSPGPVAETFDFENAISRESRARGLLLAESAVAGLASHARAVLRENEKLHLTSIVDPAMFLERHLGESFEGAAIVDSDLRGSMVDLGSGNGYPGLPIAAARPGLRLVLAEASSKKAAFLRGVVEQGRFREVTILERQVQRCPDLEETPIDLLTMRAVGGWHRILPRLSSCLSDTGRVLLWAGEEVESVRSRVAWRKLEVVSKKALPDRERSWIWVLRRASKT